MTAHLKMAHVDGPMSVETFLIGRCSWVRPRVEKPDPRPITLLSALVSFMPRALTDSQLANVPKVSKPAGKRNLKPHLHFSE